MMITTTTTPGVSTAAAQTPYRQRRLGTRAQEFAQGHTTKAVYWVLHSLLLFRAYKPASPQTTNLVKAVFLPQSISGTITVGILIYSLVYTVGLLGAMVQSHEDRRTDEVRDSKQLDQAATVGEDFEQLGKSSPFRVPIFVLAAKDRQRPSPASRHSTSKPWMGDRNARKPSTAKSLGSAETATSLTSDDDVGAYQGEEEDDTTAEDYQRQLTTLAMIEGKNEEEQQDTSEIQGKTKKEESRASGGHQQEVAAWNRKEGKNNQGFKIEGNNTVTYGDHQEMMVVGGARRTMQLHRLRQQEGALVTNAYIHYQPRLLTDMTWSLTVLVISLALRLMSISGIGIRRGLFLTPYTVIAYRNIFELIRWYLVSPLGGRKTKDPPSPFGILRVFGLSLVIYLGAICGVSAIRLPWDTSNTIVRVVGLVARTAGLYGPLTVIFILYAGTLGSCIIAPDLTWFYKCQSWISSAASAKKRADIRSRLTRPLDRPVIRRQTKDRGTKPTVPLPCLGTDMIVTRRPHRTQ